MPLLQIRFVVTEGAVRTSRASSVTVKIFQLEATDTDLGRYSIQMLLVATEIPFGIGRNFTAISAEYFQGFDILGEGGGDSEAPADG